jgi:ATP dependent DNA ligase domain
VRLYSRPGNDLTHRFPLIVETLARLRSRSCIIDGEAVACDDNGVASFNLIRYRHHDENVFLYAFDLIELNGDDLRRDPLEVRKTTLRSALPRWPRPRYPADTGPGDPAVMVRIRRGFPLPRDAAGGGYSRRQLLAKAVMAAARVTA